MYQYVLRSKGNPETPPQNDLVFNPLEDWMREFFAVAEIDIDNRSPLAESLGKLVKN